MSVEKILPIARKMGKENLSAFKNYVKDVKAGNSSELLLNLRDINIVDTVNFTMRDSQKFDVVGLRKLLKEIYKIYFPRAGAEGTEKAVSLKFMSIDKDSNKTTMFVQTSDKNGIFAKSKYEILKMGKRISLQADAICEDLKLKFDTIVNLKNADIKKRQNVDLNLNMSRGVVANEKGDDVQFIIRPCPTDDVPVFDLNIEIKKDKLTKMFDGSLEQSLPELVEKSGFKFEN